MYICFTDGSSSWKTYIGGSGIYIQDFTNNQEYEYSYGFKEIKTGQAELTAMIFCLLELLSLEIAEEEQVIIYSDSQYLVNELNDWSYDHVKQKFAGKKNIELIYYLLYLKLQFKDLTILWCKGHQQKDTKVANGNNKADELATAHKQWSQNKLIHFPTFLAAIKKEIEEDDIIQFVEENYKR